MILASPVTHTGLFEFLLAGVFILFATFLGIIYRRKGSYKRVADKVLSIFFFSNALYLVSESFSNVLLLNVTGKLVVIVASIGCFISIARSLNK